MKTARMALVAAALALTPLAAQAQDVGAVVAGNDGNPIGTVVSVADGIVTIDTGKHKAPIPADVIGTGASGPSINATRAQIDAMMDEQVAEATARRDAALVTGAAVISAAGSPVGTLASVDMTADMIVLESAAGPVALKKEHFAVDPSGKLMALFTPDQIASAAASAQGGATGGASQ